jgi:1-aminocyclopropane-1-carboxylate deaminase
VTESDLKQRILDGIDQTLGYFSRSHPLTGYLSAHPEAPLYIKREDELAAGVVGTKWRKYLSLLPALESKGIDEVILIGSAHSNNVMGLSQLLIQRGFGVTALIKQPGDRRPSGNYLLLRLLLPEERIRLVNHEDWPQVEGVAQALADDFTRQGKRSLVIPEGGYARETVPGILTLALDILRNEAELRVRFRGLWTDSGTGVSSIGLLLGMRLLEMDDRTLHITLIAGSEKEFRSRYRQYELWTREWLGAPVPDRAPRVRFHLPATARSFGSVNRTVLDQTRLIARATGILMDPVYSVKHLYTTRCLMEQETPEGPQLILYNGGPLGLCGFQSRLA